MSTPAATSENMLQYQYEAVFILANEGLEAYFNYLESHNIPLFLSDEEEKYFQDQGTISTSERLQFILKTSRIHQWRDVEHTTDDDDDDGEAAEGDDGVCGAEGEADVGDEELGLDKKKDLDVYNLLIADTDRCHDRDETTATALTTTTTTTTTTTNTTNTNTTSDLPLSNLSEDEKLEGDTTDSRRCLLPTPNRLQQGSTLHWPESGVCVLFQPPLMDSQPHIHDVILNTISQARLSIKIAMYLFTDIFIYNALCEAASNALVSVDILLDAAQVDKFLEMLGKNDLIIPEKVTICQNSGTGPYQRKTGATMGIAHEKFLICDETTAVIGSYNYTWSAAHINRENVIIIREANHPIIKSLIEEFSRLQESCILIG